MSAFTWRLDHPAAGLVRLILSGEMSLSERAPMRQAFDSLIADDGPDSAIDFSTVRMVSSAAIGELRKVTKTAIGIHAHNDGDMAVANSLAAVEAGATMVQGTLNGWGERCGNANLISVIPALQLKMGHTCVPEGHLKRLTELSRTAARA